MFWFKRSKIELVAYTQNPVLAEVFPIAPAKDIMPRYYGTLAAKTKRAELPLDHSLNYIHSIKTCYGIHNFNKAGFVVPLWNDVSILVDGNFVSAQCPLPEVTQVHDPREATGVLDDYHSVKLISPWVLNCNTDVKFIVTQNFYDVNSTDWFIPTGIVDFYNQTSTNMFIMVPKNQTKKEIVITAGTPFARIVPLTDKEVVLRVERVNDMTPYDKRPTRFFFSNTIYKVMRQKKINAMQKGCPFHGGSK